MTTILLTGFEPFAGAAANPSGDAVRLVAAEWDEPERLIASVLPVTFAGSAAHLEALIAEHTPDVVIGTGLAGGRAGISVERVAVNLIDARIPDNEGSQPIDAPSRAGAVGAHFTTIPVKEVTRRITDAGIPAELSHSAGTFVCNHVFFTACEVAASRARVGFLHVPWSTEGAPSPDAQTLPLDDIARAIRIAVRASVDPAVDATASGGALH